MLTHHRKPVCLSLISTDLPVRSVMETLMTLYQKGRDRFLLMLTAPLEPNFPTLENLQDRAQSSPRIVWIDISPEKTIMTMQGNKQLSYRHFWQQGVYGMTRYWLPAQATQLQKSICLCNYTRSLIFKGHPVPEYLRVEYELWAQEVQLGNYILTLEIKQ
ncbi:MAG: hypothetical protein SAL70_41435 [Scytonema sp. PMC 1070.18]|nr:hypothetical protein [Scytonema sp. PMC 1070.18]